MLLAEKPLLAAVLSHILSRVASNDDTQYGVDVLNCAGLDGSTRWGLALPAVKNDVCVQGARHGEGAQT